MIFKLFSITVLLAGCGAGFKTDLGISNKKTQFKPLFFSPAFQISMRMGPEMFVYDQYVNHIHKFNLDPLELTSSIALKNQQNNRHFLTAAQGTYVIEIVGDDYSIIKANGDVNENPVKLNGDKIIAAGLAVNHHRLVVVDSDFSVVIMTLTDQGDVKKSYANNLRVGSDAVAVAATFLNNGNLLVVRNKNTFSIVDIEATIAQSNWSLTDFSIADAKNVSWLAPVFKKDHLVLVLDDSQIYVVDLNTKAISGKAEDITGKGFIKTGQVGYPHIVARTRTNEHYQPMQVYFVNSDGTLESKTFISQDSNIIRSHLTDNHSTLIVVFGQGQDDFQADFSAGSVYRYQISDGWVMEHSEVEDLVKIEFAADYMLMQFDSPLGLLERRTYGKDPQSEKLEKYNVNYLIENYKNVRHSEPPGAYAGGRL